jgi:flagellar basal body-associated protein FliL
LFYTLPVEEVAESSPNTIMIVILICVALMVVLLAVAVVFLVKRRGASQPTTSLEVIPMEYPAEKMLAFGNGYMAEK